MYVPMEKNPVNSKAPSRDNTDYDTFGSIDSLIFEPKVGSLLLFINVNSEHLTKAKLSNFQFLIGQNHIKVSFAKKNITLLHIKLYSLILVLVLIVLIMVL